MDYSALKAQLQDPSFTGLSDADAASAADGGAANEFTIRNTDATNWVWVQLLNLHQRQEATPVLPGERLTFKLGGNSNSIKQVLAWCTTGANTTAPSGATVVTGGFSGGA
ncbi:MAG TPA: hypothetical protein VHQ47_08770 [Phycisphaerae bacterium]|nr:hypothetical protein [Phycisphaerae bacterium]